MVGHLGVEPSWPLRPTDLQSAAVASAAHTPYSSEELVLTLVSEFLLRPLVCGTR
jgi:hypothetical protein